MRDDVLALLAAMADEEREQRVHHVEPARSGTAALPDCIGGVRVNAFLGAGGSGEVYRAVRTLNGTDQTVAVKRFHRHRASQDDFDRFAREQRALATLTHSAIVRFFDARVEADGRPYLVMELAEGRSLVEFCDEHTMPLPARLRMFLRVCEAVESAHKHGVLHLDLKPSNIIATGAATSTYVKLVDFGTAKLAHPDRGATRTEPLTVRFASPERLRGDRALFSGTYPIGQLSQTYEGTRMARCGLPNPTAYSYHRYALTLDSPFVADADTRYWLSVQAQVTKPRTDPEFVFWGWLSGPGEHRHSLQVQPHGRTVLPRDRDFVLVQK